MGSEPSETEVLLVLGTRPEIIKLAPIIHACDEREIGYTVVHTGQHYSSDLSEIFIDQLGLDPPDVNLDVGSGSHAEQTGRMLVEIEQLIESATPDIVLVQGDTNSTLAGAVAASQRDIALGHVEAGLRSGDRSMPEEVNRVLVDHAADRLFAPTDVAADQLRREGIPDDRIEVTGNTIVDAVERVRRTAERRSSVLDELGVTNDGFALLTAHRVANVDDGDRFLDLLAGVGRVGRRHDVDVIYPVHPRAADRLDAFDITLPEPIRAVEPKDYLDFIRLEDAARLVLTDSGGVQEETCILGTPCVTLRDSTERPETVSVGANLVTGTAPMSIVAGAERMLDSPPGWDNPYGDGTAAEQIVDTIQLARDSELRRVATP